MLAQAALQNQSLSFSTIMKLYGSSSNAEKTRLVERDEQMIQQRNAEAQQQQLQAQQQQAQMQLQQKQADLDQKDQANIRDNETKILIATLQASNLESVEEEGFSEEAKANLDEKIREFDERLKLDRERLTFDKEKAKVDADLKRQQIKKQNNKSSTTK